MTDMPGVARSGAPSGAEPGLIRRHDLLAAMDRAARNRVTIGRGLRCAGTCARPVMTCAAILLSLCAGQRNLPVPGLGAHLDCLPRASERRRVGQVEVADSLDSHLVENRRCGDI